jgi:hypothetical protein
MCVLSLESLCKRSGNCGSARYIATRFSGRYKRPTPKASRLCLESVRQGVVDVVGGRRLKGRY